MQGRYFFPQSARCVDASLSRSGEMLEITCADGALLTAIPFKAVHPTSRLGSMRRRLDFPDGSSFDTADHDAVDDLLRSNGLLHRLESSWRVTLIALLAVVLAAAGFVLFVIPAAAGFMARHTSPGIARYTAQQTLSAMDRLALSKSGLPQSRQAHLRALLSQLAAQAPRGPSGYRLVFRSASHIGPNAFALPDGTIIVTDQLVAMVRRDEEIQGVLGHEIGHVDRAHGLQRVYQASLVPAAIAFVTGDASQLGHFASLLPGILLQSAYSRGFELEADDDAGRAMRRIGKSPAPMADLLQRMEEKLCGHDGCGPSWLGSHPDTALRAARLRHS